MLRRQEDFMRVVSSAKRKKQKLADRPARTPKSSTSTSIPLQSASPFESRPFWNQPYSTTRRPRFEVPNLLPKQGNGVELCPDSVETAVELIRGGVLEDPHTLDQVANSVQQTYAHPVHQKRKLHPTHAKTPLGGAATPGHTHIEGCRCMKCCVYSNGRISLLIQNWAHLWLASFLRHARLSQTISHLKDVCFQLFLFLILHSNFTLYTVEF